MESGLRVKFASVTYFPPTVKGSTARIGRSERGLRRERRKGLLAGMDEGGKLGGSRCGKWNRRSEGGVVQKLRRIITCSSCVFNHVNTCDGAVAWRET